LGFGESDDGLSWRALAPALLTGVSPGPPNVHSPEVGAVQFWDDQYYALVGLDDLAPLANEDFTDFRPGHTTFVSRSAAGPFSPATRNRRLLVGNASYFTRFVAAGDGVLVNHHSWEICAGKMLDVGDRTSCMAPLKRAEWDGEGVLRLRWWAANEIAKEEAIELQPALGHTAFHIGRTLILEAVMALSPEPSGLFLQGSGESGIGFVVHENGLCQYGDINPDGSNFRPAGSVDRELELGGRVSLRLIRKNRITEFYLNDYLMQCFCLPEPGTGRISLIGPGEQFYEIRAWYSA
jgi:hypothetical protein